MPVPDFSPGEVLTAAAMDSIGLWLVKTVTVGTGVTSVPVTGAFSADYDNYRIVYGGGTGSTNITLTLKLGASGTGYYSILTYADYASNNIPRTTGDNNAAQWLYVGYAGTSFTQASFDLCNPAKAQWTTLNNAAWGAATAAGTANGVHQVATAYTDFTIGANTGALTGGTIRVYGYRN
jgi:hypothetical protein